jgi:alkyl sulfatase BDS1-like metallo-beta-lactamase superfamily hydrolase
MEVAMLYAILRWLLGQRLATVTAHMIVAEELERQARAIVVPQTDLRSYSADTPEWGAQYHLEAAAKQLRKAVAYQLGARRDDLRF